MSLSGAKKPPVKPPVKPKLRATKRLKLGWKTYEAGEVVEVGDGKLERQLVREGLLTNKRRGAEPEESPNAGAE